jgi:hypothetical protein
VVPRDQARARGAQRRSADGAPPDVLALSELVFWVALARIDTRADVRPLRITSRRPPAHTAGFAEYLGCGIDAGPTETLVFAAADAAHPFLTANEPMWKFFEPELRRRLDELDASPRPPTAYELH